MMGNVEESRTLNVSSNAARYQTMSDSGKSQPSQKKMPSNDGFENVMLEGEKVRFHDPDDPDDRRPRDKVPRKILHFSDGVLEVYSGSEAEEEEESKEGQTRVATRTPSIVDPKALRWIPWILYYVWWMGSGALGYCDYLGEKLAWAFGITSPKYYYEIQEFDRMKEEREERRKRMGPESGWTRADKTGEAPLRVDQPMTLSPSGLNGDHAAAVVTGLRDAPAAPETVDFDPNPPKERI